MTREQHMARVRQYEEASYAYDQFQQALGRARHGYGHAWPGTDNSRESHLNAAHHWLMVLA